MRFTSHLNYLPSLILKYFDDAHKVRWPKVFCKVIQSNLFIYRNGAVFRAGDSYHQKGESFSLFDGCYNCSFKAACDLSCHPNPECHDKIRNINCTFVVASGGSRISQKGDAIPEGAPTYFFAIFFAGNCMKMKVLRPRVWCHPSPGSATAFVITKKRCR